MTAPLADRILGRELLKAFVQREIFCPYTGEILDMRCAVLIDGTDHGKGIHVMTARVYDLIAEPFFEKYSRADFSIYDGRELFKR